MVAIAQATRQIVAPKNRTPALTLALIAVLVAITFQGMGPQDWTITVLRGLSVGAVTFLVASGFSLIFGLMDVLNLAHGTLFMIGAYVGWTAYVRPDTTLDVLTPLALVAAGLVLMPVLDGWSSRVRVSPLLARVWPWVILLLAALVLWWALPKFPIRIWNTGEYDKSAIVWAVALEQGKSDLPNAIRTTETPIALLMGAAVLGGLLLGLGLVGLARPHGGFSQPDSRSIWKPVLAALVLAMLGLGLYAGSDGIVQAIVALDTNWRFLLAVIVAALTGAALGALMEISLIRPLYSRPIYQLMLTLGLGVIGRELVVAVWGRTQITMPKPALFNASGKGCPAQNLGDWLSSGCSTISFMGSRVRTYNEILIILTGVLVLIVVYLLIQRSRLGMIIRAGVQDREMVEALGINVRRVFTLVFALGVGLAALGGVLAGPAMGLADDLGESLLLLALIALAIGGLTSFPGAAVGSVLVGLMQQFMVKYGQIGIQLPFMAEPFKPSPPLVPASTVLLMVVVLLILPRGLFGRKE